MLASAFDAAAPTFDRHRALPSGVPEAIRAAILSAIGGSRPRILDLGAGSGRIGRAFVGAGDNYVGVDLSAGMLREFASHTDEPPHLAQASGERLPFGDAAFDAVLLIQIFGGLGGWRHVLAEVRRVLRPAGALLLGRTIAPPDGLDARMKQRLDQILVKLGAEPKKKNTRGDAESWLVQNAVTHTRVTAATWTATRTAQGFVERHGTGARFSALPEQIKARAMRELDAWASSTFGARDASFAEQHRFELQVFRFQDRT